MEEPKKVIRCHYLGRERVSKPTGKNSSGITDRDKELYYLFYAVSLYAYNSYFKIAYYIVLFLGTDILNNAIESVYSRIPPEKWMFVDVAIAPSTLTITERGVNIVTSCFHKVLSRNCTNISVCFGGFFQKPENKIDDCRIRFLSFMGIAMENSKYVSVIHVITVS